MTPSVNFKIPKIPTSPSALYNILELGATLIRTRQSLAVPFEVDPPLLNLILLATPESPSASVAIWLRPPPNPSFDTNLRNADGEVLVDVSAPENDGMPNGRVACEAISSGDLVNILVARPNPSVTTPI